MSVDRRGMSLLEIMVVLALIGIIGSLAVTNFTVVRRKAALREAAVTLANDLGRARTLATSSRSNFPGFAGNDRVVEAGIRFLSPTSYQLFVDRNDQIDGNEVNLPIIQLARRGFPIALTSPPAELRFRKDGTLKGSLQTSLRLNDTQNGQHRSVVIPLGGKAKVTD